MPAITAPSTAGRGRARPSATEKRTRARPERFGALYREILPEGAYRNQLRIEDGRRGAYMARGVFGQMVYIDPQADFAAVILSSWPEFLSVPRTRASYSMP